MGYTEELPSGLREKTEKWADENLAGSGIFKEKIAGYEGIREKVIGQLRARYTDRAIELFLDPQNDRKIGSPDGFASVSDNDSHAMEIYIKTDGNRISDISFHTDGCRAYIASGEITAQMLKGKTLDNAAEFSREDILNGLGGLPKEEHHCAALVIKSLKEAIGKIKSDNNK